MSFVSRLCARLDKAIEHQAQVAQNQLRAEDSTSLLHDGEIKRTDLIIMNEKVQMKKAAKGAYKWGKDNPIKSVFAIILLFIGLR